MTPIQKLVDNPEWQALRKSFVGTWKKTPTENIARLRTYLGDRSDIDRVRRVLNYLTGTGFRLGVIGTTESDALLDELRAIWSSRGRLDWHGRFEGSMTFYARRGINPRNSPRTWERLWQDIASAYSKGFLSDNEHDDLLSKFDAHV